VGHSDLQATCE